MRQIKPSEGPHQWPRKAQPTIECRKRDLVIRIADWRRCKDAPYFDVEMYIGGVYDFGESANLTTKEEVANFVMDQITKLL